MRKEGVLSGGQWKLSGRGGKRALFRQVGDRGSAYPTWVWGEINGKEVQKRIMEGVNRGVKKSGNVLAQNLTKER